MAAATAASTASILFLSEAVRPQWSMLLAHTASRSALFCTKRKRAGASDAVEKKKKPKTAVTSVTFRPVLRRLEYRSVILMCGRRKANYSRCKLARDCARLAE